MTESPREPETPSKMHGLWSLISQSPQKVPIEAEESDDAKTESPRSLFEVMKQASQDKKPAIENVLTPPDVKDVDAAHLKVDSPNKDQVESLVESPFSNMGLAEWSESRRETILKAQIYRSRIGFAFGLASSGLSALMMRSEIWMSIPSSITGFTAIILGYLSLTGSSRNLPRSSKLMAVASVIFGVLGIFLGPLVIAKIGKEWRISNSQIVVGRILTSSEISTSTTERTRRF